MFRAFVPGDIVRHFKGKDYVILNLAKHTETGDDLVIYQALYEPYGVYARPLKMFISKTDKEKYPDATQEYRMEIKKDAGVCLWVTEDDEK